MSSHLLPASVTLDGPVSLNAVVSLVARQIGRMPLVVETAPPFTLIFTPDLTTAEIDLLNRVVATFTAPLFSAPDNYDAIRAEVPTLRAYYQNAAPTGAQTVTAVKSIIAVLRAMLRD